MVKKDGWKENLTAALEVPGDVAYHHAIATLIGPNLVIIENYRSILRYTEQEMIVLTQKGKLKICGRGLKIPVYTKEEMQVRGMIFAVFLEN